MTETTGPAIIDEAVLRDVDREIRDAEILAANKRARANAATFGAEEAEEHARLMPAVRKFLAARMGMPLEQALAEAEAELEKAEADVIEAGERLERAKTRVRDLEGWRRIQDELAESGGRKPES